MTITKIIHQIMHNFSAEYPPEKLILNSIPEKWIKSKEQWMKYHPEYTYILWNDYTSRELIKNYYPEYLETYDNYKYPIQRVDAVRYFILHKYGGIYCDLDLYPTRNITEYISGNDEVYFPYNGWCILNSFIASSPNAPFWLKVFDKLKNNDLGYFKKCTKHIEVMFSTGPMFLNTILSEYTGGTTGRLPYSFTSHETYNSSEDQILISLEGMSWCSWDSYCINFFRRNKESLAFVGIISIILFVLFFIYLIYQKSYLNKALKYCRISSNK